MDQFAREYLERYKKCWETWSSEINQNTLFQRCFRNQQSIPLFEISNFFRKPSEERIEVLFVNCNPSGTDNGYYEKMNTKGDDFFYYDNPKNPYHKSVDDFYRDLGLEDENYAMIDLFPVVTQEQEVLVKACKSYPAFFDSLIEIFVDAVVELNPKVIVVTNAFVREALKKEKSKFSFTENDEEGYYVMKANGLDNVAFCGGMIAGKHQMDVESKKRLIRDVKNYLATV